MVAPNFIYINQSTRNSTPHSLSSYAYILIRQFNKVFTYIIDKRINANEAVDRMNDKDHRFLFTGMNPSFWK